MLRRQAGGAAGNLPAEERRLLEEAQQCLQKVAIMLPPKVQASHCTVSPQARAWGSNPAALTARRTLPLLPPAVVPLVCGIMCLRRHTAPVATHVAFPSRCSHSMCALQVQF